MTERIVLRIGYDHQEAIQSLPLGFPIPVAGDFFNWNGRRYVVARREFIDIRERTMLIELARPGGEPTGIDYLAMLQRQAG